MGSYKRSIIVATIIDSFNYGTVMQALATNETLKNFGEVSFIDYTRRQWTYRGWKDDIIHNPNFSSAINVARFALQIPNRKRGEKVFRSFIEKELKLISIEDYLKRASAFTEDAVFCVGSDQTWNAEYNNGLDRIYFLKDVIDENTKIAYCASFGREKLGIEELRETANALSGFNAISVRESSGVEILNQAGVSGSTYLFDPVLLCDTDYWKSLSEEKESEPYILLYVLNENKKIFEFAKYLAEKVNARIKIITFDWKTIVPSGFEKVYLPSISEWLSLFRNSKYVVTDSFHGTCFSFLFNREFYTFDPPKYSIRLNDVLNYFGLQTRNMSKFSISEAIDLDWTNINSKIDEFRIESKDFLVNALGD